MILKPKIFKLKKVKFFFKGVSFLPRFFFTSGRRCFMTS